MNSLELSNMLVEHRRNVLRLKDLEDLPWIKKMRLIRYADELRERIVELGNRIEIQFEYYEPEDQQQCDSLGSDQEYDCLTVGNFKYAKPGDY